MICLKAERSIFLETDNIKMKNHQILNLMFEINHLHHSACERSFSCLDIHRSQHFILMNIAISPEPLSQKEIAKRMKVSTAAVAVSLSKLEDKGYIKRVADKNDSRMNKIYLTESGREVVRQSDEVFSLIDSMMAEGLSEQDKDDLTRILSKMRDNLAGMNCGEDADEGGTAE